MRVPTEVLAGAMPLFCVRVQVCHFSTISGNFVCKPFSTISEFGIFLLRLAILFKPFSTISEVGIFMLFLAWRKSTRDFWLVVVF